MELVIEDNIWEEEMISTKEKQFSQGRIRSLSDNGRLIIVL